MITKKHSKLRAFISAMRRVLARLNNSYKLVKPNCKGEVIPKKVIERKRLEAIRNRMEWKIKNAPVATSKELTKLHTDLHYINQELKKLDSE